MAVSRIKDGGSNKKKNKVATSTNGVTRIEADGNERVYPPTAVKNQTQTNVSTNASGNTSTNASSNTSATVPKPSTTPSKTETSQATTNTQSTVKPVTPTYTPNAYVQSQAVTDALNYLNSVNNSRPGAFQSSYEGQLNDIYNKILNREPFEYDLNADMLYQQAKDQYTALGKMAMQDTMGQAAALTGGYGNSYANTAGYQAYQGYLQELNNNIPEYYQMALDAHNQEGSELLNQYSMASDMYNNEYGQYRDKVGDWYNDLSNAYNQYSNERNFDYNAYADKENLAYQAFMDAQNLAYQKERDAVSDAQWQKEYDLALNSAKTSSQSSSQSAGVSTSVLNKLEEYAAEGEVDSIERYLNIMVMQGSLSEAEAAAILSEYLPDDAADTSMPIASVANGYQSGARQLAQELAEYEKKKSTYGTTYKPGSIALRGK